ncbi:hypothetical protein QTJ16_003611 [Diplocarpon rosae]|uniref:Nonribosomal peptide synthetase 12 n=1 Tax=Diplocarpon rosae TaxID=946125 RepID=A0AAD9SZ60_9HELO|nr:hypothetical protein QTJ16_003611 [Diplocarpon rosae]
MDVIPRPEPCAPSSHLHHISSVSTSHPPRKAEVALSPSHPRATSCASSSSSTREKPSPLPSKHHSWLLRHARHTFLNVYRRLFGVVFALNVVGGVVLAWRFDGHDSNEFVGHLATATAANIMVALLVRQDYIINAMFRLCWMVPLSAPLRLRRIVTKVYEYGGVHSGAATCAVVWFTLFTGYITQDFIREHVREPAIMTTTYALLALLVLLVVTALPCFRFSAHNTFENVHRWGGWFSLALFWAELILFVHTQAPALGPALAKQPAFYFLLLSSLHAILPWLRLRKLHVTPEQLSPHALRLHFTTPMPLFVSLRISDAPLREWHSFACIPSRAGPTAGGSLLISRAGDWTRKTIAAPRPDYWVKGVPVTGVLCMARLFRRVVVVTTGSGIGPCLAVIQDIAGSPLLRGTTSRGTRCRVLWSTPTPLQTYGQAICDAVREVDSQAVIVDTRREGRPDLVAMAWQLYRAEEAEAVFVISNPQLTRKVVYGLEARGVPTFGPIWDS